MPFGPQTIDHRTLLIGQDIGLHLVDPELPGNRFGRGPVVTGQHDDADPLLMQRVQRGSCGLLDRIGNGKDPGGTAVDADIDRCRSILAQRIGFGA